MDAAVAIIVSVFGSTGIFGLIQFLISRHDGNKENLAHIKEQLDKIDSKCDRNEQATTRLQLIFLIDSQPDNKDTILQTAQRYFIELNGNGEAWALFNAWAKENKLDTGWYKALLKREKGNK